MTVSFFLEKHFIPQYYRWLTCYVCARLCQWFGQGGCFFGVINRVPASTPAHNVFCYSAVAHILTPSVNFGFRLNMGFRNKYRARSGLGLVISGSGRVPASKWSPFTTVRGYVCREQQEEIERIHPPPTSTKNRLKLFCEVGYANFGPNVFAAGKRIWMEIFVGVWLHRCTGRHFLGVQIKFALKMTIFTENNNLP